MGENPEENPYETSEEIPESRVWSFLGLFLFIKDGLRKGINFILFIPVLLLGGDPWEDERRG